MINATVTRLERESTWGTAERASNHPKDPDELKMGRRMQQVQCMLLPRMEREKAQEVGEEKEVGKELEVGEEQEKRGGGEEEEMNTASKKFLCLPRWMLCARWSSSGGTISTRQRPRR
jgi:hypothetical protein